MFLVKLVIKCPFEIESEQQYFQEMGKYFDEKTKRMEEELQESGKVLFARYEIDEKDRHNMIITKLFDSWETHRDLTTDPHVQACSTACKEAGFKFVRTTEEI